MATKIQLQRGTGPIVVLDLNDQNAAWTYRLALDSWAPAIAERTNNVLSDSLYGDVIEAFEINIGGDTTTEITDAYHQLLTWFDMARAFAEYGPDAAGERKAIRFVVQLDGAPTEWQSLVLPDRADPSCLKFNGGFLTDVNGRMMRRVAITFRHRLWTKGTEETSGVSTSHSIGMVKTVAMPTSHDVLSPTRVQVGGWNSLTGGIPDHGALLVGTGLDALQANVFGTGAPWTSVADAANAASANILRYTPTTTAKVATSLVATTLMQKFLAFAEVRNNTAAKEYVLTLEFKGGGCPTVKSQSIVVDASTTKARLVAFGLITCPKVPSQWQITAQANATGGTLDIDRVIMLEFDEHAFVAAFGAASVAVLNPAYITSMDNWLENTTPVVQFREALPSTNLAVLSTVDHNPVIMSKAQQITTCLLAYPGDAKWAMNNGGTRLTVTTQVWRKLATQAPH